MTDRAYIVSRALETKIAMAENNGHNALIVTLDVLKEILALMKEQEAEWIYGEDETGVDGWHCSECNFFEPWFYEFDDDIDFIKRYKHCPKCGRRMISYTGMQEGSVK